jgi:hypothetical protein
LRGNILNDPLFGLHSYSVTYLHLLDTTDPLNTCFTSARTHLTPSSHQTIVYDSLADLRQGLAVVGEDCEVEVVRVKNRYAAGYPAEATAGYRRA